MTLCANERKVQFKFFVHLFGRIRRHSIFSSFNRYLFSIIQFFTSEMHISTEEKRYIHVGKNRCFDLNVISKQVDIQRMSFD